MTEREKDAYIEQLRGEVSKWHHAYDALLVERNAIAHELYNIKKTTTGGADYEHHPKHPPEVGEANIRGGVGMKRTERGWAGHYIMAPYCTWHRNTLIEHSDGRGVVISSIGACSPKQDGHHEMIGAGRYYETMLFRAKKDGPYIEADTSRELSVCENMKWCVNEEPAIGVDLKAEAIHEEHVKYVVFNFDKVWNS